jgi:hypothetical protein
MTASPTHLTPPDNARENVREMRPLLHAALGDGYTVTVSSPRRLSGAEFCSVLRFVDAIRAGHVLRQSANHELRQSANDAELAEVGV